MACRSPSMLAVTSCECERSISHLRTLKTRLPMQHNDRDTPQWTRSAVHTQSNILSDAATVVEGYARRHPRRLQLINLFTNLAV